MTSKKLLIKLTPLEPYFFGGERIFDFAGDNKHYFIRSLDVPSQTTLFGALRYMGIQNPNSDYRLTSEDSLRIGYKSYNLTVSSQDFGQIISISPLYLMNQNNRFLIRTPFDHKVKVKDIDSKTNERVYHTVYKPFVDYNPSVDVCTLHGKRFFPLDYIAKDGIADSWLTLDANSTIERELFTGIVRPGINIKGDGKGFFKKEYKMLEKGYAFAFFTEVASEFMINNKVVYIWQK